MSRKSRALKKLRTAVIRARKHANILKKERVRIGSTMKNLNNLYGSVEKIDIGESSE